MPDAVTGEMTPLEAEASAMRAYARMHMRRGELDEARRYRKRQLEANAQNRAAIAWVENRRGYWR